MFYGDIDAIGLDDEIADDSPVFEPSGYPGPAMYGLGANASQAVNPFATPGIVADTPWYAGLTPENVTGAFTPISQVANIFGGVGVAMSQQELEQVKQQRAQAELLLAQQYNVAQAGAQTTQYRTSGMTWGLLALGVAVVLGGTYWISKRKKA